MNDIIKKEYKSSDYNIYLAQATDGDCCGDDIEKIAKPYGLDYYRPQIEIISSEQMIDNYSTHALPVHYPHWSFGKSFAKDQKAYQNGDKGLAFEVVINSNPSICYIMNNNT